MIQVLPSEGTRPGARRSPLSRSFEPLLWRSHCHSPLCLPKVLVADYRNFLLMPMSVVFHHFPINLDMDTNWFLNAWYKPSLPSSGHLVGKLRFCCELQMIFSLSQPAGFHWNLKIVSFFLDLQIFSFSLILQVAVQTWKLFRSFSTFRFSGSAGCN